MRLEWSRQARADVRQLRAYISQDSPFYARQFIERLFKRIDNIPEFPQIGRSVPEAEREDIREIIYRGYRTAPDHLLIVTVLHGSRDLVGQEKKPWEEG
ncbi:MAG: type II toxin-antitoxin system RelE/ParE family toxin [Gammaproteobacteria bacterium]